MYLRTVRGEIRMPNLSSSSLAIRSSPHKRFSLAILRISARSSFGIGGPTRSRLHAPKQSPAGAVPANHGGRLHDHQSAAPIKKLRP